MSNVDHHAAPVVLRGGTVHDPSTGRAYVRDVRIDGGVIADGDARPGDRVIDVTGRIVAPGLVDLHTHVFAGQDLGVDADGVAFPSGTTTMIDTGSAGAHLIGAFRASTLQRSRVGIRAFLNIATIGATSILLGGELRAPWYVSEEEAVAAIEANRDFVVGVKVRASANVGGEHTRPALAAARRVADRVSLPLMVHLGPPPVGVDEIADSLREGDILTHAFTGWSGNAVVDDDGRIRPSVARARERGVLLDIGHGASGFSLEVARRMLAEGQPPDTISTDLHAYSSKVVGDLPQVMSRFLALGMPFGDVLRCTTVTPARAVGLAVGELTPGSRADVTVLELVDADVEYADGFGATIRASHELRAVKTFLAGQQVYERGWA